MASSVFKVSAFFNPESDFILVLSKEYIYRAQNHLQKILDWTMIWPINNKSSFVASMKKTVFPCSLCWKLRDSVNGPARLLQCLVLCWSVSWRSINTQPEKIMRKGAASITKTSFEPRIWALLQKRRNLFLIRSFFNMAPGWSLHHLPVFSWQRDGDARL